MLETHDEAGVTLRYGFVTAMDETAHTIRAQIPDLEIETWWLPVLTPGSRGDKHYGLPDIGEQVAVLLDRRGETGVCLGCRYSQRDPVPVAGAPDRHHIRFADGTTIDYDRRTHRLAVHVVGETELISDGPVLVRAPAVTLDTPQTTCTGNVLVQGRLTYQGGMTGSGGGGVAASLEGNVSVHGNIDATGSIMDAGGNSSHHSH